MRRRAIVTLLVVLATFAGCGALESEQANYDRRLLVANQANETRTAQLEVVDNESGDVVFEQRVTIEPNTSRTVFDFESIEDSGATEFWVSLETNNETARTYVRMSKHTGDIWAMVYDDRVLIMVED